MRASRWLLPTAVAFSTRRSAVLSLVVVVAPLQRIRHRRCCRHWHYSHPRRVVTTTSTTTPTTTTTSTRIMSTASRRSSSDAVTAATTSNSNDSNTAVPLIDVDCNLWHQDLTSLQHKTNKSNGQDDDDDDDDDDSAAGLLPILQEDAVQESHIVAMLSPSSTLEEARKGLEFLSSSTFSARGGGVPQILTTVGIHPYHVNGDNNNNNRGIPSLEDDMATIRELLEISRYQGHICAIGECGLDASDGFPPVADQIPWFRAHVQLAQEQQQSQLGNNKPLFVHERLAFAETMDILRDVTLDVPVIIHCFTGTRQECQAYVERGYSLSVSGFVAKPDVVGVSEVRACLEEGLVPLDKLMIETDAPYMGFAGCRQHYLTKNEEYVASLNSKKRKRLENSIYPNVPSSLPLVLEQVVDIMNRGRAQRGEELLDRDQVARITAQNAIRFFGFDGIDI